MNNTLHDKISHRARSLWRERGCPADRDAAIWFEAEQQVNQGMPPTGEQRPNSFSERAKIETAAESVVEYQITPASSEQEAIRAAVQKPDLPAKTAVPPAIFVPSAKPRSKKR